MRMGIAALLVLTTGCGQGQAQDDCARFSGVVRAAMEEEQEWCQNRIDVDADQWDVAVLDSCLARCKKTQTALDAARVACENDQALLSVIAETRAMAAAQMKVYETMKAVQLGGATNQDLVEALMQAPGSER